MQSMGVKLARRDCSVFGCSFFLPFFLEVRSACNYTIGKGGGVEGTLGNRHARARWRRGEKDGVTSYVGSHGWMRFLVLNDNCVAGLAPKRV